MVQIWSVLLAWSLVSQGGQQVGAVPPLMVQEAEVEATPALPGSRPPLVLVAASRPTDRLEIDPFDEHGKLRPEARRAISRFLRDRRAGRVRLVHPGLVRVLYQISLDYPGRPILVLSGYRSLRDRQDGPTSPHYRGRAVDFRIEGVKPREVFRALWRRYDGIAVGYYPEYGFVHVDVRPRPVRWIARNGVNVYARHSPEEIAALRPIPAHYQRKTR